MTQGLQSSAMGSTHEIPWRNVPGRPPESLWGRDDTDRRSIELTPLFVHRFVGTHGARTPSHHDCWELIHVFRGHGTLHTDAPYPFRAGCTYLLPPEMPHREQSEETMDTLWIGLTGRRLKALGKQNLQAVESPQLEPLLEQLWLGVERPNSAGGPELDGLLQAAVGRFFRLLNEKHSSETDLLNQAVEYLRRSFSADLRVADVAARFGFSEGYFYRAFKRRAGVTPVEYVTQLRVEQAQKLLQHSSMSVSRVARLVGYRDPLYFSRIFRKYTGHPPSGRTRNARGNENPV
jgi:AraC family transcriptional regulator, arabinose operon regulatory protein